MGKLKGRAQLERGLAFMGLMAPPKPAWSPPPADECHEERTDLPLDATNMLKLREWWAGKLLVDFAMTHLTLIRGEWVQVARIDCCHSEAHRHLYNTHDSDHTRLVLRIIRTPEDVSAAYDQAYTLMVDGYEEHLRRWNDR